MQAKSKIRWQINYAQNSWPLCWVRSVNWLQTRCRTKTKEQIVVVGNSTAAGSSSNINFSYSSSSSFSSTSTLATGREAAASLRSRARKTYFRIHQQAKVVPDSFVSPDFTSSYCCQCRLPPATPLPSCCPSWLLGPLFIADFAAQLVCQSFDKVSNCVCGSKSNRETQRRGEREKELLELCCFTGYTLVKSSQLQLNFRAQLLENPTRCLQLI